MDVKTLAEMTAEVDTYCHDKGWREHKTTFYEAMALLHSEVSEALEAWRTWGLRDATAGPIEVAGELVYPHNPKPEGVGSEFADIFVRLLDDCALFGIDLTGTVSQMSPRPVSASFAENMDRLHVLISKVSDAYALSLGPPVWPLAAVLAYLQQLCGAYGVDLLAEYERKMQYNRSRPYKHGGRSL